MFLRQVHIVFCILDISVIGILQTQEIFHGSCAHGCGTIHGGFAVPDLFIAFLAGSNMLGFLFQENGIAEFQRFHLLYRIP